MTNSKITEDSINSLKELAQKASKGTWTVEKGEEADAVITADGSLSWDDHGGEVFTVENAAYLAAANPEFILALIADRNRWKKEAADNLRIAEEQHSLAQQG